MSGPESDNTDPHLAVIVLRAGAAFSSYHEVAVVHPESCSGETEDCAVADYTDALGVDESFLEPWPHFQSLTFDEKASLVGREASFAMTRSHSAWASHNVEDEDPDIDYSTDYKLVWL